MLISIITAIGLIGIETPVDIYIFKKGLNDKPYTTIIRIVLACIASAFIPGVFYMNLFLIGSTFFMLFDFVLNIARWKDLPKPYNYKIAHNIKMTWFEKNISWPIQQFTKRFFWHGDELTTSLYDKAFQRIPPMMELLIKITIFSIAIYYY